MEKSYRLYIRSILHGTDQFVISTEEQCCDLMSKMFSKDVTVTITTLENKCILICKFGFH